MCFQKSSDTLQELEPNAHTMQSRSQKFTFCVNVAGSTDMGNVSHVVASISPAYDIGGRAVKNSKAFHDAAGSPDAQGRFSDL